MTEDINIINNFLLDQRCLSNIGGGPIDQMHEIRTGSVFGPVQEREPEGKNYKIGYL